jgi:hypothetical protein
MKTSATIKVVMYLIFPNYFTNDLTLKKKANTFFKRINKHTVASENPVLCTQNYKFSVSLQQLNYIFFLISIFASPNVQRKS